jgi:serine/threonine protein phosphatase PrpC
MLAFQETYQKADTRYISEAEEKEDAVLMCCGTCAVAAYIEYGENKSQVTVGNLGDSRAVAGKFRGGKMFVESLSEDHSVATSPSERSRLRQDFPDLPAIITMGDEDLEEHGTVMGLCRFTRSLGDCHMKSTGSAEAFNDWHTVHKTGLNIALPDQGKQYISSTAECRETSISDGFILIACDGIWDEMDNQEAANICGRLLVKTAMDKTANVADLFVAECLQKAATRVADEYDEEENMTIEELRKRPCGKAPGARSLLHDDMTVIVIDFVDTAGLDKRATALKMDLPPSSVPVQHIPRPKPMVDPRLSALSVAIPGASTPPQMRKGTKNVRSKCRRPVTLNLSAPPRAAEAAGAVWRVPAMALDGGEGQGKGKAKPLRAAKNLKTKRRGSSIGAVSDLAAASEAVADDDDDE